jgi:hypothetical protein
MTAPLPPPSRRDLNSPAVLIPALLSGCLPLIVIFIAALVLPAALVAAAAWLFGLSDVQQVAAAVIVVGAEMVLFSVALLLVLSQSPFFNLIDPLRFEDENEDEDDQTPF